MCRRLVVAVVPVRVLLLSAKHLILAAMAAVVGVGVSQPEQLEFSEH